MESESCCSPRGKASHPHAAQMAVSYEQLDREFITASRQDAALRRYQRAQSTSILPKIATGRSVRSAKKLWEDYECIEVRSKLQRESERQPEVPPLRVPKNPHGLSKHAAQPVKPFRILHSQSDFFGRAGHRHHQLRQLYAEVTYLSNAVRNCDGTASYRGMCKRQRSYRRDDDSPLHLHWPSSDENIPVPRLLLPVMPGTNTKWYSWKVDTPRDKPSPRGRGVEQGRGCDKRHTASAPVSRSLDFLERYGKSRHHVAFSADCEGGRQSKEADAKSRDGHLSVRTADGTNITESLASSSLSSIVKYDATKFKLKDDEAIEGKAIFLTQAEPRKMSSVKEVPTDVAGAASHGNREREEDDRAEKDQESISGEAEVNRGEADARRQDGVGDPSPEDEMDIVARANILAPNNSPPGSGALDPTQTIEQEMKTDTRNQQPDEKIAEQEVAMATVNESEEPDLGNGLAESKSNDFPGNRIQASDAKEDTAGTTETQDPSSSEIQTGDKSANGERHIEESIQTNEDSVDPGGEVSQEADTADVSGNERTCQQIEEDDSQSTTEK